MKSMRHLLAFILLATPLWASQLVAESEKPSADTPAASLVVLPVIYYTPETRLAFGAGGIYTFRPPGTPPESRPSYFQVVAVYTQNKQFTLSLEPNLYFKHETLLLAGLLELSKFPNKFRAPLQAQPGRRQVEARFRLRERDLGHLFHRRRSVLA